MTLICDARLQCFNHHTVQSSILTTTAISSCNSEILWSVFCSEICSLTWVCRLELQGSTDTRVILVQVSLNLYKVVCLSKCTFTGSKLYAGNKIICGQQSISNQTITWVIFSKENHFFLFSCFSVSNTLKFLKENGDVATRCGELVMWPPHRPTPHWNCQNHS